MLEGWLPEVADLCVGAELGAASTGTVGAGASAASSIQPLAPLRTSWMRIKPSLRLIGRNGRPAGKPNIADADAEGSARTWTGRLETRTFPAIASSSGSPTISGAAASLPVDVSGGATATVSAPGSLGALSESSSIQKMPATISRPTERIIPRILCSAIYATPSGRLWHGPAPQSTGSVPRKPDLTVRGRLLGAALWLIFRIPLSPGVGQHFMEAAVGGQLGDVLAKLRRHGCARRFLGERNEHLG